MTALEEEMAAATVEETNDNDEEEVDDAEEDDGGAPAAAAKKKKKKKSELFCLFVHSIVLAVGCLRRLFKDTSFHFAKNKSLQKLCYAKSDIPISISHLTHYNQSLSIFTHNVISCHNNNNHNRKEEEEVRWIWPNQGHTQIKG
jgi:hypothetical protein